MIPPAGSEVLQPVSTSARPPCPACGGARFRGRFAEHGRGYESCRECGFLRGAEPPSALELARHYGQERAQGEAYWQEHSRNLEKFGALLARIERWGPPGRFLDVGCSIGTSLLAAGRRGWEPAGIELARPAAEYGRSEWGLAIRTEELARAGFPAERFDLVWLHHTLEHLAAPLETLAEARRVLRPGGRLFLAVPNHGGLKALLFGRKWSYGVTFEHLSLFSRRTLARLVRRAGFEPREAWTPSHREDPRLLHDAMDRLGLLGWLMRRCGRRDGGFDQEIYVRLITDRRLPRWLCSRAWPARLVRRLGLGEEAHLVAVKA